MPSDPTDLTEDGRGPPPASPKIGEIGDYGRSARSVNIRNLRLRLFVFRKFRIVLGRMS